MNAPTRWIMVTLFGAGVGCGGSTLGGDPIGDDAGENDSSAHDGGATDGSSISDVSVSDALPPLSPACPTSVPSPGAACTDEGVQCEYGDAWWSVGCDTVTQCTSGEWQLTQLSYDVCTPEPGPNSGACPATLSAVTQGATCSPNGTTCSYPDGLCQCTEPLGGPVQIDGGSTPYWSCIPEPGCPYPRPLLGTTCVASSQTCTYEDCSFAEFCRNGTWQGEEEGCAIPAL